LQRGTTVRIRSLIGFALLVLILGSLLDCAVLNVLKSQALIGVNGMSGSASVMADSDTEVKPWQYRWWNTTNWLWPTQMSGEFVAVGNTISGLASGYDPALWFDRIMVLPLNIAYGIDNTNFVWFQFSIEFRSTDIPGDTIAWNIQDNVYDGTTQHYHLTDIDLPYVMNDEYFFSLSTSGNTATFTLVDLTSKTPWHKDFTIPGSELIRNPQYMKNGELKTDFSPASCVEGITKIGNSLVNVPFFQFRIHGGIDFSLPLEFVGATPPGIMTERNQISTSGERAWYWMMLRPGDLPIPRLMEPTYQKNIVVGGTATIDVLATNDGGQSFWQTIAIDFPEGQPVSNLAVIESDLASYGVHNPGENVNGNYTSSTVTLVNYLVEGSSNWPRGVQHHLKISFRPVSTGTFVFYIKSVASISDWACNWDPKSGSIDQQGELVKKYTISVSDRVVVSTHFSVYYNITGLGSTTDEYAQAVSYAFERSWMNVVVDFGFNAPPDSHMTVYLKDLPPSILGNMVPHLDPVTGWHVDFIEIDVGRDTGLARATATREFFHSVELSYGTDEADWIREGMAKWAESRVYPEYIGSSSYVEYANSYMNDPDRALPQYGFEAVLFWVYIDQHYGTIMLKNVLQQTISKDGIAAVDSALSSVGTSFTSVFKEWSIANYFKDTYYSNGALFNSVSVTQLQYTGQRVDLGRDVTDWGADYYEITTSEIYMPMQFLGYQHQNLTKILIEHGKPLVSDFMLFIPYEGSYWLMQANNLDKIVIIVRSLGVGSSNDRSAYTLTWLGYSETLKGPYSATSSQSKIYLKNDGGIASSSSVGTYTVGSSGLQQSSGVNSTVAQDETGRSSSAKPLYAIGGSGQQNSHAIPLYTMNDTGSQISSTGSATVASNLTSTSSSPLPIEVEPIPPTAIFSYIPPLPVVNQTVTFDAADSTPNGGTIVSYYWDFGDASVGNGMMVTHAYVSAGNYTVTLNVTDSEWAWDISAQNITVYESGVLWAEIKNLVITDQNGNSKTDFGKGDTVQFNFTIENKGSLDLKNALISEEILDPENTPLFISYTIERIDPGASKEFIIGYRIALTALSGNYTVKIMAFTSWPSEGGTGLDIENGTFNVMPHPAMPQTSSEEKGIPNSLRPSSTDESQAGLTSEVAESKLNTTIETDKDPYLPGETVKLSGVIQDTDGNPAADATIGIEVRDPNNNTVFLDITFTYTNGTYRDLFRLHENSLSGEYETYVTASATGYQSAMNQNTFLVLPCSLTLDLHAGWNMVSFPVIPTNTTFASIFTGKGYYQVLTWSGTSYTTPINVATGRGYWVLVLSETTLEIEGVPVDSYELDLPAGWSMIGSVYGSIVDAESVFPDYYQLLTWSGTSYVTATTIEPGKGYWALVLEPTHIIVG